MCEAGVSSTSPSSRISSLEGQVHLLAVPEHLLKGVQVQSLLPASCGCRAELWLSQWGCSMEWSTHSALSSATSRWAGLSVGMLWVLAGCWWLGCFAGIKNVLCLNSPEQAHCVCGQCVWIFQLLAWKGAGHGWSGAGPWAMGQKHCWEKTKWSWENWQEKKERELRELVSRILVFALDHKARWDHLCEKTSLWRLI